jgi:NADH-quinone oxidoreductase subunit N
MMMTHLITNLMPETVLFISINILLLYGILAQRVGKPNNNSLEFIYNKYGIFKTTRSATIQILIIVLILFLNKKNYPINIQDMLEIDSISYFFSIFIILGAIIVLTFSYKSILKEETRNNYEFFVLILFATLGMILLTSSVNLLTIYLCIELQSLAFYILASINYNSEFSIEAGFKYFILGSLASGFLVLGFILLYVFTGATDLHSISQVLVFNQQDNLILGGLIISIFLILLGLLFKLGAAPFHMWVADVYEGSTMTVTSFFILVGKLSILSILIKFAYNTLYTNINIWQLILLFSAVSSLVIGSIGALYQNKIKRLFAYSTISHVGFMLMSILNGSLAGLQALYIYVIIYFIMSIAIFSIIISYFKNKENNIKYINDFEYLNNVNPILAIIISIILLSFAGIPPLAGFFSKLNVFIVVLQSYNYILFFVGSFLAVISAFYYIRIIKLMYFNNTYKFIIINRISKVNSLILTSSLLFLILFFISPTYIYSFTNAIAMMSIM